jgi:hypothetical protein
MKNATIRTNMGFETQGVDVGTKLKFETHKVVVGNSRSYYKNQPKIGGNCKAISITNWWKELLQTNNN